MTEIPTSEVLNRAADLIEERGWGTGPASVMGVGGACLIGAMYAAAHGAFSKDDVSPYAWVGLCDAGRAVYQHVRDRDDYIDRPSDIWHWNDTRAQGAKEVVEVLRACAVIEASREREAVEVPA
jgi:hypothetical protein